MKQYVEKKARGRVTALNMRYVHSQEWIPKWIDIHFDNRKRILKFFDETDIGRCLHIMQRKSCYSCNFIGSNHKADITIGDYHGAIKGETYYNRMGTSIVIVNTEKGRKMLDCLVNRGNTVMIEGDKDYIKSHNPRICSTWEESSARKDFVINFEEHGLHVAAQKSWSIRERILHRMPLSYRNMKKKVKQFLIGEQTR